MNSRNVALDTRNKVPFMFVVRSLLDFLVHLNVSATLRYTPQILRLGWRLLVGKLVVASIDVTKACNLRCPYCYELPYLVTLSKGDGYTADDIRKLV
ncbi:hypothetical protein A3H26_02315 [candidate division WWE3 bacterium RIFCSPLOWO2_12_FULL_36_10]|uniref:Uncharacterized protein n=1 Tax=candidate division WWE3 bacterium RIFCSPLOWO2_12_FULL_36_10 TaxID=1802630 RepID=A0A1F4VHQ8_UNCKA|nr:MAG: hypothetical protein A3H26_02315 [candidate division WWE3 bacterium RIFCSPLOWO2_12_FULL_36_10]